MPTSVAVAVASSYIGSAVAGSALAYSAIASTSWLTYSMIAGATTMVAGAALNSALAGSQGGGGSGSGSGFAAQASGRDQVVRSGVANRTVVYGRAMVSGPLVFAASSGSGNGRLHMVIPLAGHEIDAVEEIYFNDVLLGARDGAGNVTTGQYAGVASVRAHLGAAGDSADAALVSAGVGWTAAHRLSGVAHLVVELDWSQDAYPTGIPNVKAVVRGKKVYDPRTATTAWNTNFALCVRDYLTSSYGLECAADEVDDAFIIAAANIADESITLADGSTEARYACNGVVDLGQTPRSIMEGLLSSGAGFLVWTGGKYVLHAGAYTAPAITLTADDLRDSIRVRPRIARRDLFNAVRGTYVDPAKYWQPTDFPPVSNASYATQDGGQVIWRDVALPFTTSNATAQRMGKIMLERSRQGITVEFPAKLTAFKVATLDTVMVTIAQLGWAAKEFKVLEWKFSPAGGVDLVLQEETAASYNWNSGMQTVIDAAPDTNLPDPFTVAAPGTPSVAESLYQTTSSSGVKTRATMAWAAPLDVFVTGYLPEYKPAADAAWTLLPRTAGASVDIDDLAPGSYHFRVRAENSIGVRSAYSATTTKELLGLTAAPSDIAGFSITKVGGMAVGVWQLSGDLDVRLGGRIVVRHSPLTSGAGWNDGIILEEFNGDAVTGLLPLITGTYMAKAKDSTGSYSTTAATFVATEGMVSGFTTVATSTQHPTFGGSKTNTAVVASALQLESASTVDAYAGNIDTWPNIDSIGGISATGSYSFDAYIDFATVSTRRLEADIKVLSFDTGDLIDSRTANIDEWGDFDGGVINDCDATLYYAATDDDPAGAPAWGPWTPFFVSDVTCRAVKFRLDLVSGNPTHNLSIQTLRVDAKTPA